MEGVIKLKKNIIPRGMVQLERIFNLDKIKDQDQQAKKDSIGSECDTYNMGTPDEVKNVFIGKVCIPKEKKGIIDALHVYQDIIAWIYEVLKTYDTLIITHTIPLKPDAKPFRQR